MRGRMRNAGRVYWFIRTQTTKRQVRKDKKDGYIFSEQKLDIRKLERDKKKETKEELNRSEWPLFSWEKYRIKARICNYENILQQPLTQHGECNNKLKSSTGTTRSVVSRLVICSAESIYIFILCTPGDQFRNGKTTQAPLYSSDSILTY